MALLTSRNLVFTALRKSLKAFLPPFYQEEFKRIYWNAAPLRLYRKIASFGKAHYCPVCQSQVRKFLPFGLTSRNALCPVCGTVERHRLVWLFLQRKTNLFALPKKKLLHVAPEFHFSTLFQKSKALDYVSVDLIGAPAMVKADVTALGFPAEIFDVIYCSHVLEHIPNDQKAMQELWRVLKKDGWAIIQVPIESKVTFEDPSIVEPKERERLFGHVDHVRVYGEDYYERLQKAGFKVAREQLAEQKDRLVAQKLGLLPKEEITFCTKQTS